MKELNFYHSGIEDVRKGNFISLDYSLVPDNYDVRRLITPDNEGMVTLYRGDRWSRVKSFQGIESAVYTGKYKFNDDDLSKATPEIVSAVKQIIECGNLDALYELMRIHMTDQYSDRTGLVSATTSKKTASIFGRNPDKHRVYEIRIHYSRCIVNPYAPEVFTQLPQLDIPTEELNEVLILGKILPNEITTVHLPDQPKLITD